MNLDTIRKALEFDSRDEIFEANCHGPTSAAILADNLNAQTKAMTDKLLKIIEIQSEALKNIEFCPRSMSENVVFDVQRTATQAIAQVEAILKEG